MIRRLFGTPPLLATTGLVITLGLGMNGVLAQSQDQIAAGPGLRVQQDSPGKADVLSSKVTLDIADSTVQYAIEEIARQAKLTTRFNMEGAAYQKRISVRLVNVEVREALKEVFKESGLVARLGADGASILVREEVQSNDSTRGAGKGTIRGMILDSATRQGIQNVTVSIRGTKLTTTTGTNGAFVFNDLMFGNYTIDVKLIGYISSSRQVRVDKETVIPLNVVLNPSATALSEVVTTATGRQRRVEVANDIARIDAAKIMEEVPVRSLTDLIEAAQITGVHVTRTSGDPGAPARIRMRGIGSIAQNNDPVVIVDGVWINAAMSTEDIKRRVPGGGANTVGSSLDDIDPEIIETIEIVRGPSAATLYGQDAANGVIVITTKRGQAGSTRWSFNLNRDWSSVPRGKPPTYMGFGHRWNSSATVQCGLIGGVSVLDGSCIQDSVISLETNDPFLSEEGRGHTNRYTISLDGGVNSLLYAINGVFQDQLGARRMTGADQARIRLLDLPIGNSFIRPSRLNNRTFSTRLTARPRTSLDLGISLTASQRNGTENTTSVSYQTIIDPRDTISVLSTNGSVTPGRSSALSTSGLMGLQADWRPTLWFRSALQTGVERTVRRDAFESKSHICKSGVCERGNDTRANYQGEQSEYTVRLQSSVQPKLGAVDRFFSVRPTFGADFRKSERSSIRVTGKNVVSGSTHADGLQAQDDSKGSIHQSAVATAGWYLNATFGFFERLYFDTGIRQDIGSAITSKSNAIYPKLGTSWLISDESFFPVTPLMSTLRLRFAFGHAAVQPDIEDIHGRYVTGQVYVNGVSYPIYKFTNVGNSEIRPERATEIEAGFDTDILNDRVQLGVTFVRKYNRNNLINRNLAPSSGVSGTRKENVARVENRGFEMSVTGRVIDRSDLLLTVMSSITVQDNQVTRLGSGVSPFGPTDARIVEGYPIGGIWRLPVIGYSDINGDGLLQREEVVIGDTVVYLGWMQPKLRANYNATLTLRNRITFDTRFAYNGEYTHYQTNYDGRGNWDANAPLNEQAMARLTSMTGSTGNRQTITDLRLTSASVSYHAPQEWLQKLRARDLRISLQGSNLGLWTQYRGRDPGVNSTPVGEGLQDNGKLIPPLRSYSLSIRWGY